MEKSEEDIRAENRALRAEIRRLRKQLKDLTPSLEVMLKRRGFRIYRKKPSDDLLIPAAGFIDGYYEMCKRYSFRLFLRDVIKHQPLFTVAQVTRYATREVTEEYMRYLADIGLAGKRDGMYILENGPIKSFGETLEWFVAEVFRREFLAEAVWGIKMKRPLVGGDYDLLAKVDGTILYMEIKSSPPKQIYQKEISAFFERVRDLMPGIVLFLIDTELRMKDKIVPMFEDELRARFPVSPEVRRVEKELFEIAGSEAGLPRMFIVNAKDSIEGNIGKVLARYFRGNLL
ncbi:MAG TPA: hypothetical protein VF790_02775 [Dissulfurispiraceae bacterium]